MKTKLLLLNIFVVANCFFHNDDDHKNFVEVKHGGRKIIGKRIIIQQQNYREKFIHVDQFLGIPYAEKPINERRFQRPSPINQVDDVLALNWPPNCRQKNVENLVEKKVYLNETFQEDCLYLNIWRPSIFNDNNDGNGYCEKNNENNENCKLLPVFVYIHGGCLLYGSSSFPLYNGKILSAMTNSIVITINYRLSTFGLLYNEKNIKGNMAIWDQIEALKWINENIESFGGNSKQITIAGNSAGGWSVGSLILSPISRNLFKNAIMMSGGIQRQILDKNDAKNFWLKNIRHTNCATDNDNEINDEIINCLMKMDPKELDKIPFYNGNGCESYLVVDDELFPEHPMEMLRKGNFKKNFNLIVSTVEEETTGLLEFLVNNKLGKEIGRKFRYKNPDSLSLNDAVDIIIKMSEQFTTKSINKDDIKRLYFNGFNFNNNNLNNENIDENLLRRIIGKAFGDVWLGCPTIEFGEELIKNSINSNSIINVYELYHTFKLQGRPKCPKWSGTCHMDELYPLFGHPILKPNEYHKRECDIANELFTILYSFIRSKLNKHYQNEWQSYKMIINNTFILKPSYQISNYNYNPINKNYQLNYNDIQCKFWQLHY